ncbi:MAG TPA: outer membrane protein assembly factor BamC [Chromatiaceae bacterium]|jgi:outer membrane protein assembly factor BamC|nr:outer membrane protein assembly factor BamC [Chromatiaceae bacterium]HIN82642.1 outer membrane protein assembly factor BamC [Chromatiales bacterium]HIA08113.1 outer membrane protein assembly factor BamC [Chromatiaceae bacterium]HIB85422.1 outer membrane protein assembly factor BamC [Chromatiaceae bacterium]HIO14838.1 outer membrane protein assembly factor BamC [Chromatiales bacterium]
MKRLIRWAQLLGIVVVAGGLISACSTTQKDIGPTDYQHSESRPGLQFPPGLSTGRMDPRLIVPEGRSTRLSTYDGDRHDAGVSGGVGVVLPEAEGLQVMRSGSQRWLRVSTVADTVWPQVREFFVRQGFEFHLEDPRLGILETTWRENKDDIPQTTIRRWLGKAAEFLYESPTRDRYRVRLERLSDTGQTDIFITHRRAIEIEVGPDSNESTLSWAPGDTDPEREAEMLTRLMVYLGADTLHAEASVAQPVEQKALANFVKRDDQISVLVSQDFADAWRAVGLALDRLGMSVQDRNRTEGKYYVHYADPYRHADDSVFSKLAFWRSDDAAADDYIIGVTDSADGVEVTLSDADGERSNSETAERILQLLLEQLL